jgi:transposase
MDNNTFTELLGFSEMLVTKIEIDKRKITLDIESNLAEKHCPCCLKKCNTVNQHQLREIRDLSILGREVYLRIVSRQFICKTCNRYFYEQFEFVGKNQQMSKRLEAYLYQCCHDSSFKAVAIRENILWDVLQNIFDKYSKSVVNYLAKKVIKRIGIDEIAYRKGKKDYATVITDLDTSEVIDVLDFRTKEGLIAYFKAKGKVFCETVEVFSCDMFEGFSATSKAVFPNADIVIDRFHFFTHLNEVLNKERKSLRKQDPKNIDFKEIKWLLFKHWQDLTTKQKQILLRTFKLAPVLRKLYFIKNELVNIFNEDLSIERANELIEEWILEAKKLKNDYLDSFIKMCESWKSYIITFFKWRISNGIVEGINNAIKTLKRVAYGFLNFKHFRNRILIRFALH